MKNLMQNYVENSKADNKTESYMADHFDRIQRK